ncbi:MAG TPA: alpha/beta hydrolase [Pyrinomonadaceae bacterium]|nr:alpha/beta hydrolase [Pyrinomonadaceae bacterium]
MIRKYVFFILSALMIINAAQGARAQGNWADKSPHRSGFVTANGIKLHYLDWGGKGKVLLFLAGLGNSAHIFDDIAPRFTDRFHVLALTRRGHGQSDKPATGYDIPTLAEDIRQFLDQMNIKRVTLVGHSFAGDEMTRFATDYPDRIDKLIYLDAAYDRADLASEAFSKNPFPTPRPSKEEMASLAGYRGWWERNRGFWSDAVENDLRETSVAADGAIKATLSREVGQAIFKNAADYRPDYTKIKAPALSLYAIYGLQLWVPQDETARRKAQEFLDNVNLPYQRKNIEKFRKEMPKGRVVEIKNSHHYLFIKSLDEVVREMRKFLR